MTRYLTNGLCGAFAAAFTVFCSPGAIAQESTSREVVQPLPSGEVQRLNRALLELARSPSSITALLEAGNASLSVGDLDAAVGFFTRASELDAADARSKLGLARVYLRSGRPVEALPLLEEAERTGARPRDIVGARALAFDLVGDQEAAQTAYAQAIELSPQDDEARRRFAISQAISGNASGFQETLAPLIEARNVAAFRSRAFGLAILGEQERAEGIVNSIMPRDLAARINPYLAYMPRLTPSQQAAAANLGIFPRAADIGREDPRIARFARESESGSRLEPSGAPLGAPLNSSVVETTSVDTPQSTQQDADVRLARITTREIGNSPKPDASPDTAVDISPETPEPVAPEPVAPEPVAPEPVAPEPVASTPAKPEVAPANVADAFADMNEGDLPDANLGEGAVDIATLDVAREATPAPEPAPKPAAKPEQPKHPSRIWVQLATGRDVTALGFDWRRFSRTAPDLLGEFEPHVTPWGQANRLLAGPIESNAEARRLVNALSKKGIETFAYTSPQGTEIQELKR